MTLRKPSCVFCLLVVCFVSVFVVKAEPKDVKLGPFGEFTELKHSENGVLKEIIGTWVVETTVGEHVGATKSPVKKMTIRKSEDSRKRLELHYSKEVSRLKTKYENQKSENKSTVKAERMLRAFQEVFLLAEVELTMNNDKTLTLDFILYALDGNTQMIGMDQDANAVLQGSVSVIRDVKGDKDLLALDGGSNITCFRRDGASAIGAENSEDE